MTAPLILPRRTLLVLCGPAGCGKSTFAAQRFPETMIVSSDRCRGMICDDENNQNVNRDTFDLFHYILRKRMSLGYFSVADSAALMPFARQRLRELSRQFGYFGCLLIFDTPLEVCIQRDSQRARQVGKKVITYHIGQLLKTEQESLDEGWDLIKILSPTEMGELEIVIQEHV